MFQSRRSWKEDVDWLQETVQCCGLRGPTDWNMTIWYNITGNESVPFSCCKPPRLIGCNVHTQLHPETIFDVGCSDNGEKYFAERKSILVLLMVLSSIANILVAALIALLFSYKSKKEEEVCYMLLNLRDNQQ